MEAELELRLVVAEVLTKIEELLTPYEKSCLAFILDSVVVKDKGSSKTKFSLISAFQQLEKKFHATALSLLALLIEDVGGSRHLQSLQELLTDEEVCIDDQPELAFRRMLVTKVASHLDDSQVHDFVTNVAFVIGMDRSNFTDDKGSHDIFSLFSKLEAMERISHDNTSNLEEWLVKFLKNKKIAHSIDGFNKTVTVKRIKSVSKVLEYSLEMADEVMAGRDAVVVCRVQSDRMPEFDWRCNCKTVNGSFARDTVDNGDGSYTSRFVIQGVYADVDTKFKCTCGISGRFEPEELRVPVKANPLWTYAKHVKSSYENMTLISDGFLGSLPVSEYVSLALIKPETLTRDDSFSRDTIRGTVDDIIRHKVPIGFSDVFPQEGPVASSRTLIEGRPGCGKTTLCTKVCKDWQKGDLLREVELLLLVQLRKLPDMKTLNLKDLLALYETSSSLMSEVAEMISHSGGEGVGLILDGLDEYRYADGYPFIKDIINGTKLPNAAVFATTRPAAGYDFRSMLQNKCGKEVEIIGFVDHQIDQYIDGSSMVNPEALKQLLKVRPNVRNMCYIPLHLSMVVLLFHLNGKVPETETELYYSVILTILQHSIEKENPDAELEYFSDLENYCKLKNFKDICHLAFEGIVRERSLPHQESQVSRQMLIYTRSDIREFIKFDFSSKEWDRLGLLTVDRQMSRKGQKLFMYSFLHLTMQEFLAAWHLTQYSDDEVHSVIQRYGGSVKMRVVWKFYCGLSHENSSFLDQFQEIVLRHDVKSDNRLAVINTMYCALESSRPDACRKLLDCLDGRIDVRDVNMSTLDCSAVGHVASCGPSDVKELDFSYCLIGPEGVETLVEKLDGMLLENAKVLRLRARINPVGMKGARSLIKLVKKLPNLQELRLYGNELSSKKFKELAPVISRLTNIRILILSRNCLGEDTGILISHVLWNLHSLTQFYISYNPLQDKGFGDMLTGLLQAKNLTILGLRDVCLGEQSGEHISRALEELPVLKSLLLYSNQLGDKGVVGMASGLEAARSLEELSLVQNKLGDASAHVLANYLRTTHTLKRCRLYYNNFCDEGKFRLRASILGTDIGLAL